MCATRDAAVKVSLPKTFGDDLKELVCVITSTVSLKRKKLACTVFEIALQFTYHQLRTVRECFPKGL